MTRTQIAFAVIAATAVSTLAAEADAQTATVVVAPAAAPGGEGADRPGFSVAAQVGFLVGNGGYSDFATGVRGGYTFPFHLYVGGDATFYLAGTFTVISLAPEVGYDIGLGSIPAVVRPYVGLGFIDVPNIPGGSGAAFEIYPGGEFLYSITREFFVGGDVRIPLLFVSGATGVGLNLMGTVGYKF